MRPLRLIPIALSIILVAAPALAQVPSVPLCLEPGNDDKCETWTATFDGTGAANDTANAVATDPSGSHVFVTGETTVIGGEREVTTIAYDAASGARIWVTTEPREGVDEGRTIAVTPDGETVLVGGSGGATGMHLMAYEASTGSRLWRTEHVSGVSDRIEGLALSQDGATAFITGYGASGYTDTGISDYDFTTVAVDIATGHENWTSVYQGDANFWDVAVAVDTGVVDETGQDIVAVTGRSNGPGAGNNQTDYVTVGYDAATGEQLWKNSYDGPAHDREYPYALDISGDTVFVTGESWGLEDDYATVAYDLATGAEKWSTRRTMAGSDRPLAILASEDVVYVTGHADCCLPERLMTVVAYDAQTGAVLWEKQRSGPTGEVGHELALSPDGDTLYVGGMRGGMVFGVGVEGLYPSVGYARFLVVAFNTSDGTQQWAAQFEGGTFTGDIAITDDGTKLFITGGGQSSLSGDYSTAGYSL
ncbi:MAG: hypothetical protein QOG04_649 [Actinomycetota bacterium]|nr:hypothetical protein [Actinomycetota bacterium]